MSVCKVFRRVPRLCRQTGITAHIQHNSARPDLMPAPDRSPRSITRSLGSSSRHQCIRITSYQLLLRRSAECLNALSSNSRRYCLTSPSNMSSELEAFMVTFDNIRKETMANHELRKLKSPDVDDTIDYLDKMLLYNVPHGKRNRGLAVVLSYRALVDESTPDFHKNVELARILGWCVELLQAFFLVHDDIEDNSITRRGQPCWYRQPNVGMCAINDGLALQGLIYKLLVSHLKEKPLYGEMVQLFLSYTDYTVFGQSLDILSTPPGSEVDLERFTVARYANIIKYKTAFYSFCLPVRLALYLAGIDDETTHEDANNILLEMGHYFQVQDDFMDCFVPPEVLGKIGTDIQDGKCSWLITEALRVATPEQKEVLKKNYGKDCPVAIENVKQVYRDLNLEKTFKDYEDESYERITQMIKEVTAKNPVLPEKLFTGFLATIYRRTM